LLPVNVTSTALRDENGEIVGVTSVGIEITE
jgi:sensor histidine kinase regulating citrate/malate metabolism